MKDSTPASPSSLLLRKQASPACVTASPPYPISLESVLLFLAQVTLLSIALPELSDVAPSTFMLLSDGPSQSFFFHH